MSSLSLYEVWRLVRENGKLAEKRHPMYEKGKAMKYFVWFMVVYFGSAFVVYGVMMWAIFSDSNREAVDYVSSGMPFILAADFLLRYVFQTSPSHEIVPYRLLPIPKNRLVDVFLIRNAITTYNLLWSPFFVTFAILAVWNAPYFGFMGMVGYLLGLWLVFVMNAYWYQFWLTFTRQTTALIIVPIAIYALTIWHGWFEQQWLFYGWMRLMRGFVEWNVLSWLAVLAAIGVGYAVNRRLQAFYIYKEVAREEKAEKVITAEINWLNRFGVMGEYIKLEILSLMRNSVPRQQLIIGVVASTLISAIFSFTDVYDGMPMMQAFICIYAFDVIAGVSAQYVMSAEGNYMDGLMSRKESVLTLLKAKYVFYCMLMAIPLLIQIVPVVEGKFSLTMVLGCMLFTMGCILPGLFQMAVYNNQTLKLNQKVKTGTKSAQGSSKLQMYVALAGMSVPIGVLMLLVSVFQETVAGIIMIVAGAVGTALSPWWMRNIYRRFMARRYENMQGFRDTISV